MAKIQVRKAIEKISRDLIRVCDDAVNYSGIPERDMVEVKFALQDIQSTVSQLLTLIDAV